MITARSVVFYWSYSRLFAAGFSVINIYYFPFWLSLFSSFYSCSGAPFT